jgi:hypothetical protein
MRGWRGIARRKLPAKGSHAFLTLPGGVEPKNGSSLKAIAR